MLFSNRDLKKLLLPLAIEQILVMLVGMVDTVMVSSVGEAAVSGVALVDMVNYGVSVLHAGVLGVAVPTLASRGLAALVMSGLAFRAKNPLRLSWRNILTWERETVVRILRIAVPGGVENGLFALGKVLVTSIVSGFGTVQIAANGVPNAINQIAIIVVSAVNLAVITVVGQCVGAKEYEQAEYYTKKLMKISYIATAILGGIVCLSLPLILRFYNLEPETLRLAALLIVMHNLLAIALHPTSFNLANSLRAAGDVKYTMYVGVFSMVVFRLGSAYLFGVVLELGVIGVWIAMGMDWLARSIAFTERYRQKTWQTVRAIA